MQERESSESKRASARERERERERFRGLRDLKIWKVRGFNYVPFWRVNIGNEKERASERASDNTKRM